MARDEYIRIYRSSTQGAVPSLTAGEIAANLVDNKLFIGGTNGSLITFYANGATGIITAGPGIDIVRSSDQVRIDNIGVITFNGVAGGPSLSGDGGAIGGKGNNKITVRQASSTLTGAVSVDPRFFGIGTTGHLLLASGYQVTGDTVVAGTNITISRDGNAVTINSNSASSTTIVNGVTGIGFGNDFGLTGKINLTASSDSGISITGGVNGGGVRQVTITNTGVTGIRSSGGGVEYLLTGEITITGSDYISVFTTGKELKIVNDGVKTFNGQVGIVTLTGDGGAIGGKGNNRIAVREASTSATGVASFNSSYFTVANGAVSLASGYQVTGDTVVAGTNITISRAGNAVTINSSSASSTTIVNGVTGIGFGDDFGLTGKINLTAGSGISITGGINGGGVRQVTITNTGVTSFNGLAGTVTLTGDGQAIIGKDNSIITVREASTSVTGVASFNTNNFTVANGAVSAKNITINDSVGGLGTFSLGQSTSFIGKSISIEWLGGSNLDFKNLGVTSFNGLTGTVTLTGDTQAIIGKDNNRITVREASTSATGVASFNSSYFTVANGAVSLASGYQVTGDTVVAGTNITISRAGNAVTINSSSASSTTIVNGVTGIGFGDDFGLTGKINLTASSDSGISITGGVNGDGVRQVTITNTGVTGIRSSGGGVQYLLTGEITITGSDYISVFTTGKELKIVNDGVQTFNGQIGARTLTGDGGAIGGKGNNRIAVREASTSATGVASFNSNYFTVANGAVSLASGYQVTGDTVVAGYGINVVSSSNTKTINNTGVTSFNGLTGNVTLTGDTQAIIGKDNNRITVREASTSATGVASFNSSYFTVANGAVSLAGGYQVTGDTVVAGTNITISRNGNAVTINSNSASSTTIVNGVTGIGFGDDFGLTGKINLTASSNSGISITGGVNGDGVRQVTITNTGVTGIRFPTNLGNDTYRTGAITITGTSYISVFSSDGGNTIEIGNDGVQTFNGQAGARTLTGDGGAIGGKANNRITVREASTSATGVASFNSNYFTVSNGAVSLASGYQVTGDTVVAGYGINVVSSNNTKTINNKGVTSFNGLTGNVTLTGDTQAIIGKDNNRITARVPNGCGITGVVGTLCGGGIAINSDGLMYLDGGGPPPPPGCAPDCSVYDDSETFCIEAGCSYCRQTGACVCDTSTTTCLGGWQTFNAKFGQLNTGLGVSGTSAGVISYIYLDVGNLATMGSTIESSDSVLFFDANEPSIIKTKKASISKLLLDNDNLFESKTPNQLTRNTKSASTIEFSVVLGDVAAGSQGLLKGASAHYYIAQNTVRSLNGMTGDLEFMINGCTGGGSGKITITGTINEVTVSTACPTIVIGLPDNVMVPYISISGGTFTETVSANLFIGSIAGGTF